MGLQKNNKTIIVVVCIEDYKETVSATPPTDLELTSFHFHRKHGAVIEAAQKSPVLITKNAEPYVVLVSLEHYQRATKTTPKSSKR